MGAGPTRTSRRRAGGRKPAAVDAPAPAGKRKRQRRTDGHGRLLCEWHLATDPQRLDRTRYRPCNAPAVGELVHREVVLYGVPKKRAYAVCDDHRDLDHVPEPPVRVTEAEVAKAVTYVYRHHRCEPTRQHMKTLAGTGATIDIARAVLPATRRGRRAGPIRLADYAKKLGLELRYFAERGGLRAGAGWGNAPAAPFRAPEAPESPAPEVYDVGLRSPLVIFPQLKESGAEGTARSGVVHKHFSLDLIRRVRALQDLGYAVGQQLWVVTHERGLETELTPDGNNWLDQHVVSGMRAELRRDPTAAERRQVQRTLKALQAAVRGFRKDIMETVIQPYAACINAASSQLRLEHVTDAHFNDYPDVAGHAGMGPHVDTSAWTICAVLPTLPGEEWGGCEFLFSSHRPLRPTPGARVQRFPLGLSTHGMARSHPGCAGLSIAPAQEADGTVTDDVWGAVLRSGDVYCQPGNLVHGVAHLREPASDPESFRTGDGRNQLAEAPGLRGDDHVGEAAGGGSRPRRQYLTLFMGIPVCAGKQGLMPMM